MIVLLKNHMKKRKKSRNKACLSFGLIDDLEVEYFSYNELDSVRPDVGWYCWGYAPTNSDTVKEGVSNLKYLSAEVGKNFGITYSGDLERADKLNKNDLKDIDNEVLTRVMIAFSPPLYLGISKNLKDRLNIHKRKLEEYLLSPSDSLKYLDGCDADTPEESTYFGYRIGRALVENETEPDDLFVRCIYNDDYEMVRMIEKVLNRIFTPVYGRR